jgi:GT2 family glycosyltransferase
MDGVPSDAHYGAVTSTTSLQDPGTHDREDEESRRLGAWHRRETVAPHPTAEPERRPRAAPGPTVCVVMPAYNAGAFVEAAVRSALAQRDVELTLVVVDDGSTDRTSEILARIADPRLRVTRVGNGGPARARNLAAALEPHAEFLALLDADDLWDSDKLATQLAFLREHDDVAAVGSLMRFVTADDRVLGPAGEAMGPEAQERVARGELYPMPTSSLVYRRSAFDAVGGFDEAFRHAGAEDLDLLARVARHGRVACVERVFGGYRVHGGSAMARERRRINVESRFVRARMACLARGETLTHAEFLAMHRPTLGQRRRDLLDACFRTAAIAFGGRAWGRALAYGAACFVLSPGYTLRRLQRQRRRRYS